MPKLNIMNKELSDKQLLKRIMNTLEYLEIKGTIYALSHISGNKIINSTETYDYVSFKITHKN